VVREFNAKHGIATEAWSPLARGRMNEHPTLVALVAKHGKSAAQIVLRWHLQLGNLVIPKTSNPDRLSENIDVFDFELDTSDMALMLAMDTGIRTGLDPNEF
jgi:2,5-diketo-D-gluconate reductase A